MALPEGAMPLVVGTALALGALTLVLSPLLNTVDGSANNDRSTKRSSTDDEDRPTTAVDALREIEFDRETGKLSDTDYAELKSRYTREALAELRAAEPAPLVAAGTVDDTAPTMAVDLVEAAIAKARSNQKSCGVCGPRPEPDATYCSSCGRYLPGQCASCGTSIDLVGSRFCSGCGEQLAAA